MKNDNKYLHGHKAFNDSDYCKMGKLLLVTNKMATNLSNDTYEVKRQYKNYS